MSAKSILEADGKAILNYHLTRAPVIKPTPLPAQATHNPPSRLASFYFPEGESVKAILDQAEVTYPWLLAKDAKFVAKPDQLIKRRGKSGLLALNKTWPEAREWIEARAGKVQRVETVDGVLRQFLVEPFVPHPEGTEYYININSVREVSLELIHSSLLLWNSQAISFVKYSSSCVFFSCLNAQCTSALASDQRKSDRTHFDLAFRQRFYIPHAACPLVHELFLHDFGRIYPRLHVRPFSFRSLPVYFSMTLLTMILAG